MTHTIALTDDQYRRVQSAASALNTTPDQFVADLLAKLPEPKPTMSRSEYDQRWEEFLELVGHITHGDPVTNADIDSVIGEEAAGSDATSDHHS